MISWQTEVASRTIYGEARGESKEGKLAVAHVLCNRVASGKWGKTFAEVCLAPFQFSCWSSATFNRANLKAIAAAPDDDPEIIECVAAMAAALAGGEDPTFGATYYFADSMKQAPAWAAVLTQTIKIGHHLFYKDR